MSSAVAVEEKSIVDYNEGNPTGDLETKGQHGKPRVPLVAVYPKEGTLNSDSPFAVLHAPWSEAGKQAGAKDFSGLLREPAQQELFTDAGFRTYDGRPGRPVSDANTCATTSVSLLAPPSPPVLSSVRAAWGELRKPARVLLVLDVSGSMGQSAGGGKTRLELAQAAAVKAWPSCPTPTRSGCGRLPGPAAGLLAVPPREPLGPQREQLSTRIQQLIPSGGTPLYAVTRKASEAFVIGAGARRSTRSW